MAQAQPLTAEEQSRTPVVQGLSRAEVEERVRRGETNDYRARVGRSYFRIVTDNLLNLFNIVLGTLLLIVILSGDYTTAFFAGFSVVTNSFLGMIQEINAKRKLDQLATLSQSQAHVYRDRQLQVIPMSEVVKDDIVKVEPGDRIVADGVAVETDSIEMDESLLTGESDAVYKKPGDELFSGSFCIAGSGLMRVTHVGGESKVNKLSTIAKEYKRQKTPTQIRIDIVVELTVVAMFIFVPMLFVTAYLDRLIFLEAIRNAVVFVTSLVPQGLVLVAILSLTIGAVKISQHQTLIQKVNAVESLANVTTLCFDKTGTLTRNELAVTEIISLNGSSREEIKAQLAAYLASLSYLNRTAQAVQTYVGGPNGKRPKRREIPFTSGRKWGAVVFDDHSLVLGAPERVLPVAGGDDSVIKRASDLARQGMRVLAFGSLDEEPQGDQLEDGCNPIALIIMSDQVREDIRDTLAAFHEEGIGLKVISGDNLETVQAIARESGMTITGAHTGAELDKMSDPELDVAVSKANVFARVEPETKQRIVEALKRAKHYVAMVGDGVNDVPALKKADLAIVMNDGTQISKDVADIVLLNNAMSTLPLAFHEGKEITQTIFGTMKIFLVKNMYNVLTFLFISFMSLPFPITPVQISWSTFGTVNIPATLIAFGIVRPKLMRNFRDDVLDYIVTGGLIGAILLAALYVVVYFGTGRDVIGTRSAITIFLSLYGAYIVMSVQGVEFYKPKSFLEHWRVVLLMTVLLTLTIWAMYILPGLFEFRIFTLQDYPWVWVTIYALFALSMILLSHGMRYRYLLRRMWQLFSRDW